MTLPVTSVYIIPFETLYYLRSIDYSKITAVVRPAHIKAFEVVDAITPFTKCGEMALIPWLMIEYQEGDSFRKVRLEVREADCIIGRSEELFVDKTGTYTEHLINNKDDNKTFRRME